MFRRLSGLILALSLLCCGNNPYGQLPPGKVLLTSISDDPRTLDPARVGDTASNAVASNLHDTPFEYHYRKRPLELKPAMATGMPRSGQTVLNGVVRPTFEFTIQQGLRFADDACFKEGKGREILIDDIIFGIKRAADGAIDPFGLAILSGKIVGFDEFAAKLEQAHTKDAAEKSAENTRAVYSQDIPGVRRVDPYTLQLVLTEDFPQIVYFFTLTTGSPQPRECVEYYNGQNGRPMYDRHPATSGPFILKEWHANYRITLARNPNYRTNDFFPSEGSQEDRDRGLLTLSGLQLPIVDEIRMQVIKTGPPVWTLFEQGYLDRAGIPSEVYNQVVLNQDLTPEFRERGIRLDREIDPATYFWVFNFNDRTMQNRNLRQAMSLTLNRHEMLERFSNGRGVPANSIIPPGIEGYEESFVNSSAQYSPARAKAFLAAAGYPGGIDPATGKPLRIVFTGVQSTGTTSMYRFFVQSFAEVGLDLQIEQYDWPTVLQKKYKKDFQLIQGGWHADYPDPQNFLQLLYGPNSTNSYNEGSYRNPAFDALYMRMRNMPPGPERLAIIRQMNTIVADDVPVILNFYPVSYGLAHKWFAPFKPHPTNANQLKFRSIDPQMRANLTDEWNRIPLAAWILAAVVILSLAVPGWLAFKGYGRRLL